MQMQLNQDELEVAVREYIRNQGLNLPVTSVTFTQTRNPTSIVTELQLGSTNAPTLSAVDGGKSEAPEEGQKKSRKADKGKKPEKADPVAEEAADNADDAPFSPDTKEEIAEEDTTEEASSNSLFG